MQKHNLCLFLMVLTASVWGQGVSISQLSPVSNSYFGRLDTSAIIPVVQDSVPGKKKTYKATMGNIKSLTSGGWSLNGNSGVDATVNFIGTIDVDTLQFQINGNRGGLIDNGIKKNTALGAKALNGYYPGSDNVAIGAGALSFESGGGNGIASGSGNTAIGAGAGYSLAGGNYNTCIGWHTNICGAGHASTTLGSNSFAGDSAISIGLDAGICMNRVLSISPHVDSLYMPLNNANFGCVLTLGKDNGYGQKFAIWKPTTFTPADSASIYSLIPSEFTTYACTDCTGNGITGAVLSYFGGLWRRLKFD